jgi:hypothetical protein
VDDDTARANIREVIAVAEGIRKELMAEVASLSARLDARFEAHASKHDAEIQAHEVSHQREEDRRVGLLRWAVTTLITGIGTLFAIVWAVTH